VESQFQACLPIPPLEPTSKLQVACSEPIVGWRLPFLDQRRPYSFRPWAIPGFSVDRYRDLLWQLHQHILTKGSLVTAGTAILVRATKPAGGPVGGQPEFPPHER